MRFALTTSPQTAREHFGYEDEHDFPPRAFIAPEEPILLVVAREFSGGEARRLLLARWGFLPGFVKDPATFPLLAHARSEGVMEKPSFAPAFRRRRCLAPASALHVRDRKQDYVLSPQDGAPLGLAALYETYLDPNGSEIDTACLLTTQASGPASAVADRLPVLLPRAAFSVWLDHERTPLAAALSLLRPAPEDVLQLSRAAGADTFR